VKKLQKKKERKNKIKETNRLMQNDKMNQVKLKLKKLVNGGG
jgi:hypothetical protein